MAENLEIDYQKLWGELRAELEKQLAAHEKTGNLETRYLKGICDTYGLILIHMQSRENQCQKTSESSDNSTTSPQS